MIFLVALDWFGSWVFCSFWTKIKYLRLLSKQKREKFIKIFQKHSNIKIFDYTLVPCLLQIFLTT